MTSQAMINAWISWVSLACGLQRDWARVETVPEIGDFVRTDRLLAA